MSDGKQIIKVPIRSLDEYRFVYNYNKNKHVFQGDRDSQVDDVLGVDSASAQKGGKGEGAGDQPGEDVALCPISIKSGRSSKTCEETRRPAIRAFTASRLTTCATRRGRRSSNRSRMPLLSPSWIRRDHQGYHN